MEAGIATGPAVVALAFSAWRHEATPHAAEAGLTASIFEELISSRTVVLLLFCSLFCLEPFFSLVALIVLILAVATAAASATVVAFIVVKVVILVFLLHIVFERAKAGAEAFRLIHFHVIIATALVPRCFFLLFIPAFLLCRLVKRFHVEVIAMFCDQIRDALFDVVRSILKITVRLVDLVDKASILALTGASAGEGWLILCRLLIFAILLPPVGILRITLLATVKRIPSIVRRADEILVEVFAASTSRLLALLLPRRYHVRGIILARVQVVSSGYTRHARLALHEMRIRIYGDWVAAHARWRLRHVRERRIDLPQSILRRLVVERVLDVRNAAELRLKHRVAVDQL